MHYQITYLDRQDTILSQVNLYENAPLLVALLAARDILLSNKPDLLLSEAAHVHVRLIDG